MNVVHGVSAVSSARRSAPVYRVTSPGAAVRSAQAVKTSATVQPSTQNAQPASIQGLPIGFLESVAQPPSSDAQASLDYHDLRTALDSGNLTAARQAYSRLQTDLYLPQVNMMA